MDISDLNKLTIVKLKEIAKENKIKGISGKKKTDLIQFLYHKLNERNSEYIESSNINETNENIETMTSHLEEISLNKPTYYYHKFDYINNSFNQKSIEKLLNKNLNFGDIVQFDDYRAHGSFILANNNFIKCSGDVSDDIYIPLEISKEFSDSIELYKNIHIDFYGIELNYDHKYIIDKLGNINPPNDWNFYYVNQELFENEIHIDIGLDDFYQIYFDIDDSASEYMKLINSIDYIKRFKEIKNSDHETYGIYVTLKNDNDDNLNEEEKSFIYNIKVPSNSLIQIEFQCNYYEIRFIYARKDKEELIKFINSYYFDKTFSFVKEIEPIIDE